MMKIRRNIIRMVSGLASSRLLLVRVTKNSRVDDSRMLASISHTYSKK
jgi:hypothetical protein